MNGRQSESRVRLSVLDRLASGTDGAASLSESVSAMRNAVRRDLDRLLNTRRIAEPATDEFPEVQKSLYHYGLPDITSLSGDSNTARRRLVRQVEEAIELFEPRLTNVRVSGMDTPARADRRQIRFHIEALLRLDPDPERVAFDTVLETASGKISVTGEGDA
ncbi:MAG TPA: type VI secretion system baseplate subunit TssE [Longimicrobiales bacterium]|nr:type VI secretion system baseplate subunit TssE [Longimicrobiales bacterium]